MSVTLRVKSTGQYFEATTDMSSTGPQVQHFSEGKLYGGLLFEAREIRETTGVARLKGYRHWATFRTEELETV
jgi:hypothetical protein